MLLWTWGKVGNGNSWHIPCAWPSIKRLEDRFDSANRQNLARFIQENNGTDSQTTIDNTTSAGELVREVQGLSYIASQKHKLSEELKESELEEKRELVRISACAIFYKFSRGPGVPHTFVAFIRQWPSLPKVVVRAIHPVLFIITHAWTDLSLYLCCSRRQSPAWGTLCSEESPINWR